MFQVAVEILRGRSQSALHFSGFDRTSRLKGLDHRIRYHDSKEMHVLPKVEASVNMTSEKKVLDIHFTASNQALTNSAPTRDVSGSISCDTESLKVRRSNIRVE